MSAFPDCCRQLLLPFGGPLGGCSTFFFSQMNKISPIVSLLGCAVGFFFLTLSDPDFNSGEQEWFVIAAWHAAQYMIALMLVCSLVFRDQIKNIKKNSWLLIALLNYFFLVASALIDHKADFPGFRIKIDDVKQHNSKKIAELLAACCLAISSLFLSITTGLNFEAGFFSISLGSAMKTSLAIVDETGKRRHPGYISGTFGFCFVIILFRKYLERDIERPGNDQSPTDQNPNNGPDRAAENLVATCHTNGSGGSGTWNGLPANPPLLPLFQMRQGGISPRDARQESWDINEQNWEIVPPLLYSDTSSDSGDTEDGVNEEEEEVPFEEKEGKDIVITHSRKSNGFTEGQSTGNDCDDNPDHHPDNLKVENDDEHGDSDFSDHESSDDEGNDGHDFHGGAGGILGFDRRHKDLGQESDDQEEENMRQLRDDSNSVEGDTYLLLRESKRIEVDLRQIREDVDPQDEGTSKDGDGVGWRRSNKHLAKGKRITDFRHCSGLELANLVPSSSLLRGFWKSIFDLYKGINSQRPSFFSLECKAYKVSDSEMTIIAFVTAPATQFYLQAHFASSVALRGDYNFPHFEVICSKNCPSFSVNKTAVDLFCSQHDQLSLLKSQIDDSKPLIVTGHALGGSIASLFNLWLFDSIDSSKKHPLCIIFGSPHIGDQNLQQAISQISHQDLFPGLFIFQPDCSFSSHRSSVSDQLNAQTVVYEPFGTFLFSSDKGSACFEDPESVLELPVAMGTKSKPNQGIQTCDYETIVENLTRKTICEDSTPGIEDITGNDRRQAIITWLRREKHLLKKKPKKESRLQKNVPEQHYAFRERCLFPGTSYRSSLDIADSYEKGLFSFDPSEKLKDAKIVMANLEWYKKVSKTQGVGYYDSYKKVFSECDLHVINHKRSLRNFWKDIVAESEMKPQTENSAFRKRWLFGGTNYRSMVEPLDIAEYYKDGHRDHVNQGRPKHYLRLQEWLEEEQLAADGSDSRNVESILTLDSCFWAHVEEALLHCKVLARVESSDRDKESAEKALIEFEDYVYRLFKDYAVSPEIFLLQSSYMDWWNEYKKIKGDSYDSRLANFMSNLRNYDKYAKDALQHLNTPNM